MLAYGRLVGTRQAEHITAQTVLQCVSPSEKRPESKSKRNADPAEPTEGLPGSRSMPLNEGKDERGFRDFTKNISSEQQLKFK